MAKPQFAERFRTEARKFPMAAESSDPKYAVEETVIGPGGYTFVVKSLAFIQGMWAYKCAREGETADIFTFPEVLLSPLPKDRPS